MTVCDTFRIGNRNNMVTKRWQIDIRSGHQYYKENEIDPVEFVENLLLGYEKKFFDTFRAVSFRVQ